MNGLLTQSALRYPSGCPVDSCLGTRHEDWQRGDVVGVHTLTHPNLEALDEADSGQEVIAEKALIEARALCWVDLFPSPLGKPDDHSPASIEAVKHVGHAGAVTTSLGVKVGLAQRLEAHRIQAMGSDEAMFAVALARFHLDVGRP